MDLEYFDDPDYYDKLTACTRDAYAIENLLWNTLSAVSARDFCVPCMCGSLPGQSALWRFDDCGSHSLLHSWGQVYEAALSPQLGANQRRRQKGYLAAFATSRSYAQSIRSSTQAPA